MAQFGNTFLYRGAVVDPIIPPDGTLNITGNLGVSGNTEIGGTLTVSGTVTAGGNLALGINKRIVLDDDGNTDIISTSDDSIIFRTGGTTARLSIYNTSVAVGMPTTITKSNLITTPTASTTARNGTAATSGVPVQIGAGLVSLGSGWSTDGAGSALACEVMLYAKPVSAASATVEMVFAARTGTDAFATIAAIDSSGNFVPKSDGGADLGTTALSWDDIYTTGKHYVDTDHDSYIGSDADDKIQIVTNGAEALEVSSLSTGNIATQTIATTGSPRHWLWTGAAHTTLTVAEAIDAHFDYGRQVGFTSGGGTIATQRQIVVEAATYSAAAATTITDAALLYLDSAPAAGINMTITRSYALWIDAGYLRYDTTAAIDGEVSCALGASGGATGPGTAAQSAWLEMYAGTTKIWVPYWV